jgi:hypothetical protein
MCVKSGEMKRVRWRERCRFESKDGGELEGCRAREKDRWKESCSAEGMTWERKAATACFKISVFT